MFSAIRRLPCFHLRRGLSRFLAAALGTAGLLLLPVVAGAQLQESIFRASNGQVYQVLQHRNSAGAGIGVDDVRVTTVAASITSAVTQCLVSGDTHTPTDAEAVVTTTQAGSFPLASVFKSNRIQDATAACFNPSGNGTVCIGPGCGAAPTCTCVTNCATFTIAGGTVLTTGTGDVAAASLVAPFSSSGASCAQSSRSTYRFGGIGPTVESALCNSVPSDGFLLPSATSSFTSGIDGTTIIIAYAAGTSDAVNVGAAGFLIDANGTNTIGCTGTNKVLSAAGVSDNSPPPAPGKTPTCTGVTGVLRSLPRH